MAEAAATPLRILHAHSGFNLGGKEARAVRLMNLWAGQAVHSILSAQPGAMGARAAIAPDVAVHFPEDAPSLQGKPALGRYWALARYMQQFDLVLSYNWGAMDVVAAHRLFSSLLRLPPLIHHEDGFNEDEAVRLNPKRNLFRRFMLASAQALVVPSQRLENIARTVWGQGQERIQRIPNGIDVAAYVHPHDDAAIPGFVRSPGKMVVGTLAGLRKVKNLPRLVRAVAPLKDRVQLVIVGEGDQRDAIRAEAERHGITDLCLPGFLPEPHHYLGLFDIFALSSDSEQFPISLVEAMAAGLPAVSTNVGDVRAMLAEENRQFVVPLADEKGYSAALERLLDEPDLARRLGQANRALALRTYDEQTMVRRYAALYGQAVGRPDLLQANG